MFVKRIHFETGYTLGFVFSSVEEMQSAVQVLTRNSDFFNPLLACEEFSFWQLPLRAILLDEGCKAMYLASRKERIYAISDVSEEEEEIIRSVLEDGDMWYGFVVRFSSEVGGVCKKFSLSETDSLGELDWCLDNATVFLVGNTLYVFVEEDEDLMFLLQSEFLFEPCSSLAKAYCAEHGKEMEISNLRKIFRED